MKRLVRRAALVAAPLALALGAGGAATAGTPEGLRGEYFESTHLEGSPLLERVDPTIDFDWALTEPVAGLGDAFSVRWTGTVRPRHSERYTFFTHADDGVRLWVDGERIIDDWTQHSASERSGTIDLEADEAYDIRLEYNDRIRLAVVRLSWRSASQAREIVPASRLTPATDPAPVPDPVAEVPDVEDEPERASGDDEPADLLPDLPAEVEPPAEPESILPPPVPPVAGETFNVEPADGEVLVRRPQDGELIPLDRAASLPVGSRVDAREGEVTVQTAPAEGVALPTQRAEFRSAMFKVGQAAKGSRIVDITMQHGDFESCGQSAAPARRKGKGTARAAARKRSSKRVRVIWGSGKGRFRTRGRHAAATVRGTVWQVEDRCDATVTRVKEGAVDVEDFATGRTVTVRAGGRYVARPK